MTIIQPSDFYIYTHHCSAITFYMKQLFVKIHMQYIKCFLTHFTMYIIFKLIVGRIEYRILMNYNRMCIYSGCRFFWTSAFEDIIFRISSLISHIFKHHLYYYEIVICRSYVMGQDIAWAALSLWQKFQQTKKMKNRILYQEFN